MSSIKEVAGKANVSISTVSNVLNHTKFVSPELTQRVLDAVSELDYQANPIAKRMKSAKSNVVGIISTEIVGVFYPYVIKGLYNEFTSHGYNVHMFETDAISDPHNSWEKLMAGVRNFTDYRVDGIVLTATLPAKEEKNYVNRILDMVSREKKIPVVSLETDLTGYGIDSICCDSFKGAECAVMHLIEKGCRKIAHITGPIFSRVALDRLNGYKSALKKAGLPVEDKLIINGDYLHQSGYFAAKKLLETVDFDGLFVANDQMAIGAMTALKEFGVQIPEDIKVIGYDNVFISNIVTPPLSTMHAPKKSLGEMGADLLIKRIEGQLSDTKAIKIDMETRLIVRQSTDPAAHDEWDKNDW